MKSAILSKEQGRELLKKASSEESVQVSILGFLNSVLPDSHLTVHLYNNPRSASAGAKAKRMGMVAGVPDLMIIRPLGRFAFIEVKKEGGRLSSEQRAFRAYCQRWGVPHAVCRSIADARDFIAEIGIETREAA